MESEGLDSYGVRFRRSAAGEDRESGIKTDGSQKDVSASNKTQSSKSFQIMSKFQGNTPAKAHENVPPTPATGIESKSGFAKPESMPKSEDPDKKGGTAHVARTEVPKADSVPAKKDSKAQSRDSKDKEPDDDKRSRRLNHVPPKPEQIYADRPKRRTFWQYFVPVAYIMFIWGILAILMIPIMYFLPIIYRGGPENMGPGSFLGSIPAMSYEPNVARLSESKEGSEEVKKRQLQPDKITFNKNRPITFEPYLTRLRYLLTNEYGPERFQACYEDHEDLRAGCLVDLFDKSSNLGFGTCAVPRGRTVQSHSFGFESKQPCIMIRQNKMLHYRPPMIDIRDIVSDKRLLENVRQKCIREHFNPDGDECCFWKRIPLHCERDQGSLEVYPSFGVPACHYPFTSSLDKEDLEHYQQPFYFVRVVSAEEDTTVNVKCYLDPKYKDNPEHYVTYSVQVFTGQNAAFGVTVRVGFMFAWTTLIKLSFSK